MDSTHSAYFQDYPGLGEDEYPGFPTGESPPEMPNLSQHHSLMADAFKSHHGLYEALRDRRTVLGTSLAKCIKTGMDNRGHPMIKTVGLAAGDEECYETFRPLFDSVIRSRHGDDCVAQNHPTDMSLERLTRCRADPSENYICSSHVGISRSLKGVRFPTAVSFCERREVERVCVLALMEMRDSLQGDYFPLAGSQSYDAKPGGVSAEEEQALLREQFLFCHPDSTTALCTGVGRHWPDARGGFVSKSKMLSVHINDADHLLVQSMRPHGGLQEAFAEAVSVLNSVEASLSRRGDFTSGFARSERLGYLTSCPSNLGCAMRVRVSVKLPLVMEKQGLAQWCLNRRLIVRGAVDDRGTQISGVVEVSNRDRLGTSEVDTLNSIVDGVAELVRMEIHLESGGQDGTIDELAEYVAMEKQLSLTPCLPAGDEVGWDVTGSALGYLFAGAVAQMDDKVSSLPKLTIARNAVRLALEDSLASGRLQTALEECVGEMRDRERKQEGQRTQEGIRAKLWSVLDECLDSGALEQTMKDAAFAKSEASTTVNPNASCALPAELDRVKTLAQEALCKVIADDGSGGQMSQKPACDIDEVRLKIQSVLESSFEDGSLNKVLAEKVCDSSDKMREEGIESICENLDSSFAESLALRTEVSLPPASRCIVQALCKSERRIGALTAAISAANRRICDSDARAVQLEAEVASVQAEAKRLREELEQRQQQIDEALVRGLMLQDGRQRLMTTFGVESLKLKHANLGSEPPLVHSTRSEISTACTVNESSTLPRIVSAGPGASATAVN
eukprot:TRINITY_DN40713_c0_g1_i1.p1 TRINITY_DN40713_c0_g1~~TRINITY_DN40713_c0_g1_i1.p1  ORF type:complete len:791 (+),score=125.90 TRINITY_DN40713_c0_g1_i1:189-2561(+)